MSDHWIEDEELRFIGYSDAQIAQLRAALPKVEQLLALVKKNEKDIETAFLLIQELLPVAQMAIAVLKARMTS